MGIVVSILTGQVGPLRKKTPLWGHRCHWGQKD